MNRSKIEVAPAASTKVQRDFMPSPLGQNTMTMVSANTWKTFRNPGAAKSDGSATSGEVTPTRVEESVIVESTSKPTEPARNVISPESKALVDNLKNQPKKKKKKNKKIAQSKLRLVSNGNCAMVIGEDTETEKESKPQETVAVAPAPTSAPSTLATPSATPKRGMSIESTKSSAPIVIGRSKLKSNIVSNGSCAMERTSSNDSNKTTSPKAKRVGLLRQQLSDLGMDTVVQRTLSFIGEARNRLLNSDSASGQTSGYTTPGGSDDYEVPITGYSGASTPRQCDSGVGSDMSDGGNVDVIEAIEAAKKGKMCAEDFEVLRCLGTGSFGTVHLVREKKTGRLFAQKQFKKASLMVRKSTIGQTMTEREILELVNRHPFIVKLYYAFQDHQKLYLILEYGQGGELFHHVNERTMFMENEAKFYVAEVVLALEHLHSNFNIVYRDLKPENCLLDAEGHLLLTDFGLSKVAVDDESCKSMLGTRDYMAPEVLKQKFYGKAADFWSLGCFAYHLMTGEPPWYSANDQATERKILHGKLKFPPGFSADAKDLFTRLMRREPKKRLGYHSKDMDTIKAHRFFKGIDWDALEKRQVTPPIIPRITKAELAENFGDEFTSLPLSPVVSRAGWTEDKEHAENNPFRGFSYVASQSLLDGYGCHFGGRTDDDLTEDDDLEVLNLEADAAEQRQRMRERSESFDSMKSF